MLYYPKQPMMGRFKGTLCVELDQKLLTFILRMTICYFAGPILWSVAKFFNSFHGMKWLLGKK